MITFYFLQGKSFISGRKLIIKKVAKWNIIIIITENIMGSKKMHTLTLKFYSSVNMLFWNLKYVLFLRLLRLLKFILIIGESAYYFMIILLI